MKKLLLFSFLLFFLSLSFAQTKEEVDSAVNDLCKKAMFKDPYGFRQETYADLAYLARTFNLPNLKLNHNEYTKRLNDYYYKRFYLYSKLLRDDAYVTDDCFQDESNRDMGKWNRLQIYAMYPNSMKFPSNFADQVAEYASTDSLLGPYEMLKTIYYAKKYSYNKLSKLEKDKLAGTEKFLSDLLYKKYVFGQPWNFQKFLALQVLRMNDYPTVYIKGNPETNIYFIVQYFIHNGPLELGADDMKQTKLVEKFGYYNILQYEINAALWIFLTEAKKN